MSIDLVAAALWLDMEPRRKLVLISLCDNADQDGYCWPAQPYIAVRCSLSVRSVRPNLQALEMDGWLQTIKKGSRGSPTQRVLAADRIIAEGRANEQRYREQRKAEVTSPQLGEQETDVEKGEVDVKKGEVAADRGKPLRKEPSVNRQLEPSVKEPSSRALAQKSDVPSSGNLGPSFQVGTVAVVSGGEVTKPEDLKLMTAEDVMLGRLRLLSDTFDPDGYNVVERRRFWARQVPPPGDKLLGRLFGRLALNGRKWSDAEKALKAAKEADWPDDFSWSPGTRPVARNDRTAKAVEA